MSKIKGITIWEQNVEYFVLGAAALTACAYIAMQFIGQPNAVERPPHGTIGPAQVDGVLQNEATRVNALLNAPPPETTPEPPRLLAAFEHGLRTSINPAPTIGPLLAHVPLQIGEGRAGAEVVYVEPSIPAPTRTVARQYHDTVVDDEAEKYNLQERLAGPPFDTAWVTVASVYDGEEQMRQFRTEGPDGEVPIPSLWAHDKPIILNIVAERETYLDGTWGERVTLEPNPGQVHFREELRRDVDSSGRDELVRSARDPFVQDDLLRPAFYTTKGGAVSPPDPYLDEGAHDDAQSRAQTLVRERSRWIQQRDDYQRRIEELEGRAPGSGPGSRGPAAPTPGDGAASPGGTASPGGSASPGGAGPGGVSPGRPGRDSGAGQERNLQDMRARLAQIERRIEQLDQEIERLIPQSEADRLAALPDGDILFWVHDITAAVGETYRYRFIVEVFNPFCARKLNLVESQHHLAETYVLRSEPGEWSAPITIDPPIRMFITRADPPPARQPAGLIGQAVGSVNVDIYRFHDGAWHRHAMTLTPGDRIGEVRADRTGEGPTVDFGTEWFVLDIIPDTDPRTGRVMLQHLRTGEVEERRPQWDAPARERLLREVQHLAGGPRT